jgi:hypothetical protein
MQTMLSDTQLHPAVFIGVITVIVVLALVFGRKYWRRRLTTWAEREGFELVDFRGAHAFEGPSVWRRSENQDVLHVTLRHRRGDTGIRTAWVVFGSFWNPFSRDVKVHWID